jgi:hypothetical protein
MVDFASPIVEIDGGVSHVTRNDTSVSMRADATNLPPGHAVTAWWAIFNHPEFCGGPCGPDDLQTPDVQAALLYADGEVVAADGTATFMSTLAERDISRVDPAHTGIPGAGIGLSDSMTADVHVVLRTHGAASQDAAVLNEQITTFNGGCNPTCANLQAGIHEAPGRNVSLEPTVLFTDPMTEIAGGVSRLTRDQDRVSMRTDATNLPPGDAVTAWWAIFNHPEFCHGECGPDDLRTPEVEAALLYADGEVVAADGKATFMSTLAERDIAQVDPAHTGFPGAGIGLADSMTADVHIVLRTHGAASQDAAVLNEQVTTFNGGCNPACSNLQATIHSTPGTDVSLGPVLAFQFVDETGMVQITEGLPPVAGSESRLTRDDDGLTLTVNTLGLQPAAYTVWWVVFNNPEFCTGRCDPADLTNPAVDAAILYGTGKVVGEDGIGNFTAQLAEADTSKVNPEHMPFPGSDKGLVDARKAEIHFVVRSHGPASNDPGTLNAQLTTFNGGCKTDTMNGFACFDPQAGIHLPPHTDATVGPVLAFQFVDETGMAQITPGLPPVEGSESRLTRDDGGLTLTVNTLGLHPAAYTVWWVVFNNPEFCTGGCDPTDLTNPEVDTAILYGTGGVVGEDGIGNFTAQLAEGDISRVNPEHRVFPGSDKGLVDARKAEIHFVIRSHGPASGDPGTLNAQLTTFNGGCKTDTTDGFACFDPQAGIHLPPNAIVLGDANGDGQFDQQDIVAVLQAGKYRTGRAATFAEGDWNGDGVFDQFDIMAALRTDRYVADANAASAEAAAVDAILAGGFGL